MKIDNHAINQGRLHLESSLNQLIAHESPQLDIDSRLDPIVDQQLRLDGAEGDLEASRQLLLQQARTELF
jgi:hypothetical protein